MKYKKTIIFLVLVIAIFSFIASFLGVYKNEGRGEYEFKSVRGEKVAIYGKGIYQYDSVSMAIQAKSQDYVTLFMGIPMLVLSLFLLARRKLQAKLLLTGTLGYFLYTYATYTFVSMYNPLFLIYVLLLSTSFFAFILMMISFDLEELKRSFSAKLPVKYIGGFLLFLNIAVFMLWIGRILPSIAKRTAPIGLEHYTTLVIQGLDLGIIIPTGILAGILLIQRKPIGYLLATIIMIKLMTLLTSLTAMIIGQALAGVEMGLIEMAIFPFFDFMVFYTLFLILKNIRKQQDIQK